MHSNFDIVPACFVVLDEGVDANLQKKLSRYVEIAFQAQKQKRRSIA